MKRVLEADMRGERCISVHTGIAGKIGLIKVIFHPNGIFSTLVASIKHAGLPACAPSLCSTKAG